MKRVLLFICTIIIAQISYSQKAYHVNVYSVQPNSSLYDTTLYYVNPGDTIHFHQYINSGATSIYLYFYVNGQLKDSVDQPQLGETYTYVVTNADKQAYYGYKGFGLGRRVILNGSCESNFNFTTSGIDSTFYFQPLNSVWYLTPGNQYYWSWWDVANPQYFGYSDDTLLQVTFPTSSIYQVCLQLYSNVGPCDTTCKTITVPLQSLGIANSQASSRLQFKNLSNNIIELTANKVGSLEIYSLVGARVFFSTYGIGTSQINLSHVSSGVYFIQTSNGDRKKFLLE